MNKTPVRLAIALASAMTLAACVGAQPSDTNSDPNVYALGAGPPLEIAASRAAKARVTTPSADGGRSSGSSTEVADTPGTN